MRYFYVVLFACFLLGCVGCKHHDLTDRYTNESTQIVNINLSDDNFLEIMPLVCNYRFTALEISDKCIIGEINKIIYYGGKFYILDRRQQRQIYVFDADGKYLMSIGRRGRGPGEYIVPTDFFVTNNTITVYDQYSHKINYYNLDGKYLNSQAMPYKVYEIEASKNNEIFVITGDNYNIKDIKDYGILRLSSDNKILNKYCHNKFAMNFSNEYDLYTFNDDVVYAKALQDGVFAIDDNDEFYLKYKFNISPSPLPTGFVEKCNGDFSIFKDKYANSFAYFNGQYWETPLFLGLGINYSNKPYFVIYDKKNKNAYSGIVGIRYGLQSDDINGVLSSVLHNSPTYVSGNTIVGAISPEKLPRSIRNSIWGGEYNSEFCNPVLVNIELKD